MSRKHREAEALFIAKGYNALATFNSERARGLVHTAEYAEEMAALQAQWLREGLEAAERNGWNIVGGSA